MVDILAVKTFRIQEKFKYFNMLMLKERNEECSLNLLHLLLAHDCATETIKVTQIQFRIQTQRKKKKEKHQHTVVVSWVQAE